MELYTAYECDNCNDIWREVFGKSYAVRRTYKYLNDNAIISNFCSVVCMDESRDKAQTMATIKEEPCK